MREGKRQTTSQRVPRAVSELLLCSLTLFSLQQPILASPPLHSSHENALSEGYVSVQPVTAQGGRDVDANAVNQRLNDLTNNTPPQVPFSEGLLIEDYVLGPGDVISINIFNVPEYGGQQQVLADGSLNLPVVGRFSISGLSIQQAEGALATHYSSLVRGPVITISLIQPRPIRIAIAGEIGQPGMYNIPITGAQFPSVAQAIQTAGGVTQTADLRQVIVQRANTQDSYQQIGVDLWALIRQGDLSQNITLRDGDTVTIPETAEINILETSQLATSTLASSNGQVLDVAIVGEVFNPGTYRLGEQGRSNDYPTVTQAIQLAGGVKPMADLREIQVRRTTRSGRQQLISLDLWRLVQEGDLSQDLILQEGDTIVVPEAEALTADEVAQLTAANISPNTISINLVGEVESPGTVGVPANTTLNQALLAAGGFNNQAVNTVELIRFNPDGTVSRRAIDVDLSQGIDSTTNPILVNNDIIIASPNQISQVSDGVSSILDPLLKIISPFLFFF